MGTPCRCYWIGWGNLGSSTPPCLALSPCWGLYWPERPQCMSGRPLFLRTQRAQGLYGLAPVLSCALALWLRIGIGGSNRCSDTLARCGENNEKLFVSGDHGGSTLLQTPQGRGMHGWCGAARKGEDSGLCASHASCTRTSIWGSRGGASCSATYLVLLAWVGLRG